MERSQLISALSINPLFSGLGLENVRQIADLCTIQKFDSGEMLFQKGDPGDALYGLRRGRILITTSTAEGKRLTLNVLGSGDVFGEIALLDGRQRTADAVVAEASELYVIRRSAFNELLLRQPAIALRLIELLCERVRWTSDRVEEAYLTNLKVRLARRILKLAEDFGEEIQISQEDLSVLAGATRESVNRQLQAWKRAGLVSLGRSRVTLLKAEALAAEAADPS
jgi:CRP-like cAMP-binding protein